MEISSLSLLLAVLFGWWLVTVALATDSFKVTRHRPRTTISKASTSARAYFRYARTSEIRSSVNSSGDSVRVFG